MQNFQLSIPEFLAQEFSQARVLLDGENSCAFRERKLGERSKSRPDFDDVIFVRQISLVDDPARQVLIVKKSLAETSDRGNADISKRCADLGEPHVDIDGSRDRREKFANLFTKPCEQIAPYE